MLFIPAPRSMLVMAARGFPSARMRLLASMDMAKKKKPAPTMRV